MTLKWRKRSQDKEFRRLSEIRKGKESSLETLGMGA